MTTASDVTLANVRATIQGVLERDGTFTVEDSKDQVVRRIDRQRPAHDQVPDFLSCRGDGRADRGHACRCPQELREFYYDPES